MKHCKKCDICISKHDHHCFFFDICIGEHNQRNFIGFLFSHLINTISIIYLDFDTFSLNLKKNKEDYLSCPKILYILLLIHFIYFLCTLLLFFMQIFLISTAQTTNEFLKRSSIYYIQIFKEIKIKFFFEKNKRSLNKIPFNPFDIGIYGNFKNFFSGRKM